MSLDQETRKDTVLYRMEKAQTAWNDAIFNVEHGRWGTAANRLYYALFHAVSALLIAQGIPANTHRGFLTQMNRHLVLQGTMTKEEARLVRHLFDLRQEDDYEDFIDVTENEINDILPEANALISKLTSLNPYTTGAN